jgi:hypothetical protein
MAIRVSHMSCPEREALFLRCSHVSGLPSVRSATLDAKENPALKGLRAGFSGALSTGGQDKPRRTTGSYERMSHTRTPPGFPRAGVSEPSFMMHGYVVEGSAEKHRGSPEVPRDVRHEYSLIAGSNV